MVVNFTYNHITSHYNYNIVPCATNNWARVRLEYINSAVIETSLLIYES